MPGKKIDCRKQLIYNQIFLLNFDVDETKAKSAHSSLGWSPVTRVLMPKLCLYNPLLLIHRLLEDSEMPHTHTQFSSTIKKPGSLCSANISALVHPSYQHSLGHVLAKHKLGSFVCVVRGI